MVGRQEGARGVGGRELRSAGLTLRDVTELYGGVLPSLDHPEDVATFAMRSACVALLQMAVGSVFREGCGLRRVAKELEAHGLRVAKGKSMTDLEWHIKRVKDQLKDRLRKYFITVGRRVVPLVEPGTRDTGNSVGRAVIAEREEPWVRGGGVGYEQDEAAAKEKEFETVGRSVKDIERIVGFSIGIGWCEGRWKPYSWKPRRNVDYTGAMSPPILTGAWVCMKLSGVDERTWRELNCYLDVCWPDGQVGIKLRTAADETLPQKALLREFGYDFTLSPADDDLVLGKVAKCMHQRLPLLRKYMTGYVEVESAVLGWARSMTMEDDLEVCDVHFLKQPPCWSPHRDQHSVGLRYSVVVKLEERDKIPLSRHVRKKFLFSGLHVLEPEGLDPVAFGPGSGSCVMIQSQRLHRSVPMEYKSNQVRKITFFLHKKGAPV